MQSAQSASNQDTKSFVLYEGIFLRVLAKTPRRPFDNGLSWSADQAITAVHEELSALFLVGSDGCYEITVRRNSRRVRNFSHGWSVRRSRKVRVREQKERRANKRADFEYGGKARPRTTAPQTGLPGLWYFSFLEICQHLDLGLVNVSYGTTEALLFKRSCGSLELCTLLRVGQG